MTTSVDRLRAWLSRSSMRDDGAKGARVFLVHEQIGVTSIVCNWAPSELTEGGDGAQLIYDAAQEHCDDLGTQARYTVELRSAEGSTLATKPIRLEPNPGQGERPVGAGQVEDPSIAGILGQVLRHQEVMCRMYVGSTGGILNNMQAELKLQADQIQELNGTLKLAQQRLRAAEARAEDTEVADAQAVEYEAKAEAWNKVGTAVATELIPLLAQRLNGAPS
jgi:hypothetical protein